MKPSLNAKFLVAHEIEGGKERLEAMLASLKETRQLPDALTIEGTLLDSSVNTNKWRVPESEFDSLITSLKGAPYLKDHKEEVDSVAGQVVDLWKEGGAIKFKAEVDDPGLIRKILKGRVKYSSVQVESDRLLCSKCFEDVQAGMLTADECIKKGHYYSRKDEVFSHLHKGAHEIVFKPKGKEVSAVVFPAYSVAEMGPALGFKAALDRALGDVDESRLTDNIVKEDGGATPRGDASDKRKDTEPRKEVRKMADEEKPTVLTAKDIAEAVTTSLKAYEASKLKAEEERKKEADYGSFIKGWEGALGKIKELEQSYQAGVSKLEGILKKYEDELKRKEEASDAGRKLREAKKKEQPPEEDEEKPVEAVPRKPGEEDEEDEAIKKEGKHEASAKSESITGKAVAAELKDGEMRTGLSSKLFPPWYREIAMLAKKHPRREA